MTQYGVRCQDCGYIVPPLSDTPHPTFTEAPPHLPQCDPDGLAEPVCEGEECIQCPGTGKLSRVESFIDPADMVRDDIIDCGTF